MRTRPKAILSVFIAFSVLFLCLAWILSQLLLQNYLQLEQRLVQVDVMRLRDALDTRIVDLHTKLGDWAQWDDTYHFIQNHNQEYINSNLQPTTFDILKINIIAIADSQGDILFSKRIQDGKEVPFPDSLVHFLQGEERFRRLEKMGAKGVLNLPEGTLVFALRPVVSSDGEAPTNGQILFGHFLTETDDTVLSDLVHFPIELNSITDQLRKDAYYQSVLQDLDSRDVVIPPVKQNTDVIYGYTEINDYLTHQPALLLRAEITRTVFAQGRQSILLFLQAMAIAGVVIVVVVISLFEVIVLRRLSRLEQGVVQVRTTSELYPTVKFPESNDEFGSLTREINQSLHTLYATEFRLKEQRNELKKFQLAAEESFNHLVITDANGVILYANPAVTKNTGYSNREIIGKKPSLWGRQMPKNVYVEMWNTIKEKKQPYKGEVTNKRKDGTRYLVEVSIAPILDDQGIVQYFVGLERDITEERARQKRHQEHLIELENINNRLSSEKARAEGILRYLRSIAGGVYATDRRGMIVFVNDAAAELIGENSENLIGKDAFKLFQFCEGTEEKKSCLLTQQVLLTKHPLSFPQNTFLVSLHKEPLLVAGTVAPIIEQQHIAGVIVVFQDMSDFYKLEKMKANFLSVAAHQLRTPLGSMRWSMELLLQGDLGKLPKAAKEAVEQLYENSKRMIVLVGDLLSVARMDQKENQEEKKLVDVGIIWDEVIKTMKPQAEKLGIALVLKKKTPLKALVLPPRHIFEAFENLVSNALKYNRDQGEVIVNIEEKDGGLCITIQDTGIGIPKSAQSKIFSKFFRAPNAILKETEGSGLGLSVVKSYIEEAGGTISFESKEGVGTTFFIKFPFGPVNS